MSDYDPSSPETTDEDETPMTVEEARAHFEAMGIEIIGPDQVTIH